MMQGHTHKCDAIWQPDRAIRLQIRRDTSEWMGVSFYIVPFGPGILLFGDTMEVGSVELATLHGFQSAFLVQ